MTALSPKLTIRMWLRVLAGACVIYGVWACFLRPISIRSGPVPQALADGWQTSTPAAEGLDAVALRQRIDALFASSLNVHSVLVERHGKLVSETYQGGKDRSVYSLWSVRRSFSATDKQDVRSIGKSVTGLLYGVAIEQGRVPDPSASVLASYPALVDIATTPKQRIRVEDLLNMANGLQWQEGAIGINDELRLFWKRDIARYVFSHDVAVTPNTRFNYNGGGTAVLADLITRGTGMPLDVFARKQLFDPLGIRDWAWVKDVHGRPMAFNGLRLRPRDLLKLGRLVLNKGRWQGQQLVPAAWIERSMAPRFETDVRNYRYGYQWWGGIATWHGRPVPWHAGFGNGGQRLYVVPDLDMTIVTTAGAYDEDATAIRVNDLIQEIIDCVQN